MFLKSNDVLSKLVASTVFNVDKADFSGMTDNENWYLYISSVIHQAVIYVNEQGIKASIFLFIYLLFPATIKPSSLFYFLLVLSYSA